MRSCRHEHQRPRVRQGDGRERKPGLAASGRQHHDPASPGLLPRGQRRGLVGPERDVLPRLRESDGRPGGVRKSDVLPDELADDCIPYARRCPENAHAFVPKDSGELREFPVHTAPSSTIVPRSNTSRMSRDEATCVPCQGLLGVHPAAAVDAAIVRRGGFLCTRISEIRRAGARSARFVSEGSRLLRRSAGVIL